MTRDGLMTILMEGLHCADALDYEIIDVSNGTAWVEIDGRKFTVRVEDRED